MAGVEGIKCLCGVVRPAGFQVGDATTYRSKCLGFFVFADTEHRVVDIRSHHDVLSPLAVKGQRPTVLQQRCSVSGVMA